MKRLLQLALDDLANAQDNLYRARAAACSCDPSKPWGQSGETLNQIIAGYEKWKKEAEAAVAKAKRFES